VHYIVFVLPYCVYCCAVSVALLFVRPYTVSIVGFCLLSCYVFQCAACNSVLCALLWCAVYTVQLCVRTAAVLCVLFNTMHLWCLLRALHSVSAICTDQCGVSYVY